MKDKLFFEDNSTCHKIWEDKKHLAFLSIYPNCEGVTVVIPKKYYSSYAFELEDKVLTQQILATKKVTYFLDNSFDDVSRTALVFEGFCIDHVCTKGYKQNWKEIKSNF